MANETSKIKNIDDAVKLLRQELDLKREFDLDLKESRFEFYFGNPAKLRYEGETIPLQNHHHISCCNFYEESGKVHSSLIIDVDPDWGMLNSANYFINYFVPTGTAVGMGINLVEPRTNKNPDVAFGRTDSHTMTLLGIGPEAKKVSSGLSAIFVPRNIDYIK